MGETVVVRIMKSGKMLGDFTLMMPKGTTLKNESLVEMYSRQTALLLEYYQSKQDVNHFFEVSPDLMLVINKNGNMLRLNTAWHRTLGFPVDTLTGRKIMEFIHPEDVAKTEEALKEILDKRKINNFVNRYVTSDNNYRSLEWRATLQGELIYAAARDITEKLEAEKEVQEKSELQKTLMNIALRNINPPLSGKKRLSNDSSKQLAQFAQADWAYIFDYLWEEEITRNTYEWCAPGISPQIKELQAVPLSLFPEWVATHKKGEIMYVSDVAELPKESGLRQVLEPQNIKRLITIPMMENGACVGFVGFDWVKAHHEYKSIQQMLLELFAQMLVNIRV
ncbi:MAG: PAS domain S-box protein [Bacteroidales bacterium]|nr:PAS domain S-box protein [Bacteroidales bacterium]